MAIYKNPHFDETCPLRISFTGQPAIDTGGPRREFFYQVFSKLADGDNSSGFSQLFEGPSTRLVPVYNARVAFSGLMKCVGQIIAHAIAHCEIGFPRLSPVCYWYLINQDVSEAISYANISDIRDISVSDYIRKVCLIVCLTIYQTHARSFEQVQLKFFFILMENRHIGFPLCLAKSLGYYNTIH